MFLIEPTSYRLPRRMTFQIQAVIPPVPATLVREYNHEKRASNRKSCTRHFLLTSSVGQARSSICSRIYKKERGRFASVPGHQYFGRHSAGDLYARPGSLCHDRPQRGLGRQRFVHTWKKMAYTKLIPQHTTGADVKEISLAGAYRLIIPAGPANQYRLAQLDDYAKLPRGRFPLRPPISLSLSARASSDSIPGTWGFGFWNHPFGLSLEFGGTGPRLPTLPNAVWFFGASKENYLSFRDDKPAHGFLAQVFRSPRFHPLLIPAGLALPFFRKIARRLMRRVVAEDGARPSVDVTQWHSYRLNWRETGVSFEVDDAQVFHSSIQPRPPLGSVIWVDNQYAAFTPEGKIGFGVLENPEPAWLEIKDIHIA